MVCGEEDLKKKDEEIKKLNHQLRILGNTVGDPASVEKFRKRSVDLHEEVQTLKEAMAVLQKKHDDLKISSNSAASRVKELEASDDVSQKLLQTKQATIDKMEEDFSILREELSITRQELDIVKTRSDQDVALQWLQSPEGLKHLSSEWIKTEAGLSFLSSAAKACLQTPKGSSILKDKCFSYFRKGMVAGINQSVTRRSRNPGVPLEKFEPSLESADWGFSKEEMDAEDSYSEDDDGDEAEEEVEKATSP